jgi:hypothetical protein
LWQPRLARFARALLLTAPGVRAQSLPGEPVCVIAVDLGTARSGYAFAFTANPEAVAPKVRTRTCSATPRGACGRGLLLTRVPTRRVLRQEPGGTGEDKTLTNVLFSARGEFLAFGKKAREEYQRVLEGTWRASRSHGSAAAAGSDAPAGGARACLPRGRTLDGTRCQPRRTPPAERGERCDLLFFEKFKMLLHEGSQGASASRVPSTHALARAAATRTRQFPRTG